MIELEKSLAIHSISGFAGHRAWTSPTIVERMAQAVTEAAIQTNLVAIVT
jgi:hypothetical protein